MPRRASSQITSTSLKRADPQPSAVTPSRRSKRIKSSPITPNTGSKTTPKKSKYFEQDSDLSEAESEIANEASGYEDEDESASAVSSPPESEGEDEDEDEEYTSTEEAPIKKRRKSGRKSNGGGGVIAISKPMKGQELWRPGVKTTLAPGEELFIKLPKAREAGKTPYQDDTIHPNTFAFLGDLKENNDREWLKVHDADYRQSQKDFNGFVECLTGKIIEKDDTIPELPPKDLTFRIYRDVRFSSDPTPFKTHYSAAWSRTGRKGPYAAYYLQIAPSGSFIGAGLWQPEAPPLALMRRAIDRRSNKLKDVLLEPTMRKEFLKGAKAEEKAVVKAFVEINKENMLKTKPKGYTSENPNIALLRLRNFTIGRKLSDSEILTPGAISRIAHLVGVLTPFVTYLNSIVMPDDNDDADDDDDDDDGEDDNNEEEGESQEGEEEN